VNAVRPGCLFPTTGASRPCYCDICRMSPTVMMVGYVAPSPLRKEVLPPRRRYVGLRVTLTVLLAATLIIGFLPDRWQQWLLSPNDNRRLGPPGL